MTNFKLIVALTFSLYAANAFSAAEEYFGAASEGGGSTGVTAPPLVCVQGRDGQYRTSPAAFKAAYDSLCDAVRATEGGKKLKILELGFGTADSSAALSVSKEFPGKTSVTLLDSNTENVIQAARKLASLGWTETVTFMRSSIPEAFFTTDRAAKIEDESQDIVYASWVLHFLQPPMYVKAIKGIHRVLKPGGKLIYAGRSTTDPKWLRMEHAMITKTLGSEWEGSYPREALVAKGNDVAKPWGGSFVHPAVYAYRETAKRLQGTAIPCDVSKENLRNLMRNLGFEVESIGDYETSRLELRQLGGRNSESTLHYTAGVFRKAEVTPEGEGIVMAGLRSHFHELLDAKSDPSYTAVESAVERVFALIKARALSRKV